MLISVRANTYIKWVVDTIDSTVSEPKQDYRKFQIHFRRLKGKTNSPKRNADITMSASIIEMEGT